MERSHSIAYFFGGLFLANAIPHLVSGMTGKAFQSPFAKPHGIGLSSSTVNVVWGFFNMVMAYLLIMQVGDFDPRSIPDILSFGIGALAIALFSARHFGKFHGGQPPKA